LPCEFDFRDRARAFERAGFTGMGLFYTDLPHVVKQYGYAGMRSILADHGIRHLELEALIDWFADGERRARSDETRALLLRSAEALGAFQIKAVGDSITDYPQGRMTEALGALADQARDSGTRVSIEIMAGSNISNLTRALEIVEAADRPNAGILLDVWHIVRGQVPYADIARLPKKWIFGVELNDGSIRSAGTPFEDTVYRRRFCGEGEFDLAGFVDAARVAGYEGPFGVEVLSDRVRTMPLDELAPLAYQTTQACIDSTRDRRDSVQ
jgi:sugar phosphate isomerase/epimerase